MQTMRTLGNNMAWLLKCIEAGKKSRIDFPENEEDISQDKIFKNQLEKYIAPKREVAILNSFPLFLFEYKDKLK